MKEIVTNMANTPAPIAITDAAIDRIRFLLKSRGKPSAGIKVGVRSGGCSGLAYTIEYADEVGPFDEVVPVEEGEGGFNVLIDPKAIMYLIGTQMDYVEEKMKSGFTFNNPNEEGRCGCGESFHV